MSERVFDAIELIGMWVDTDRIYLAKMLDPPEDDVGFSQMSAVLILICSSLEI